MNKNSTEHKWPKIGNEKAVAFLDKVLESANVASSYIFSGYGNLGKATIAISFARKLQGQAGVNNSDLHILERAEEEKSISIEAVRDFIRTMSLGSFLGGYKIGIIKEASYLSEEAKSALLKTLEEPKEKVVIILLVDDINDVPKTIVSRCQVLYFQPVSSELIYDYLIDNYNTSRSLAKDLANLSLGKPIDAINYLEKPEEYKNYLEKAETWLDFCAIDNASERMAVLDKLFSDKTWSREAREESLRIITMAEGLARDLLLLSFNQSNLMQHIALADKLVALRDNLNKSGDSARVALHWLKVLSQAKEYLKSSINPRLVLEQVAINY